METPYKRAQQEWDNRMGTATQQMRMWRTTSLVMLALVFILVGALVYLSSQNRFVPYIVELKTNGEPHSVGAAATFRPDEHVIKAFLSDFVELSRSLPSDPVVARKNWRRSYVVLSDRAARLFSELKESVKEFGHKTRSVQVDSVLALSKDTYQAEWIEEEFELSGASRGRQRFRGIFTITRKQPTTEKEIKQNPLGILIDHLAFSKI